MAGSPLSRLLGVFHGEDETDPFGVPIHERSDYPIDGSGWPVIPREDVIDIFPRNGAWGHNLQWWPDEEEGYENRRVVGWLMVREDSVRRTVEDGDMFAYEMGSGFIGVFRLINVENKDDPRDMFFADALDIGYLEEVDDGS